ncbi:MAG: hypothetical protein HY513_01205 [Candidatus Aenigmarchaeota archaeon]|nr:hypothetical protein [Candidatus Aenigmarchaeota archaeon]
MPGETYANLVDYKRLDPVKLAAMEIFTTTLMLPERMRIRVMPVGESGIAFEFLDYDFSIGFNVEGLGTKNLIADSMYQTLSSMGHSTPEDVYYSIGRDTAAMSVNDLCSCGADPIAYGDFLTAGSSDWFEDEKRNNALLSGYKIAADLGGFSIPCGETPALPGVVDPKTLVLEGASLGLIKPKERLSYGQKVRAGDVIYGLPSGGIAANGISKSRKIAAKLSDGYFTLLPSGRELGRALLDPTPIIARPVIEMFDEADLHYASPITGHGWAKVARPRVRPFRYVIETLPEVPEVLQFLVEHGASHGFDVSDKENYSVWNMGTVAALIAPPNSEAKMREIAARHGMELQVLGHVEEGEQEVYLAPKDLTLAV